MFKKTVRLPVAPPYTIVLHLHFYDRYFNLSPLNYLTQLSVAVLRQNVSNNRTGK